MQKELAHDQKYYNLTYLLYLAYGAFQDLYCLSKLYIVNKYSTLFRQNLQAKPNKAITVVHTILLAYHFQSLKKNCMYN